MTKFYYIHPESESCGVVTAQELEAEQDPLMEIVGEVKGDYPTQAELDAYLGTPAGDGDAVCSETPQVKWGHLFGRVVYKLGLRTIIAGSRDITNGWALQAAIDSCPWIIGRVVCGGARGVDRMGELWAQYHGIPIDYYPADWKRYGNSAGPKRNVDMANNADALIAVWDNISWGTRHMINQAFIKELPTVVHLV